MKATREHLETLSTGDLVNTLLVTRDEDDEDSLYWNAIWVLRQRATDVEFRAAKALCESACSLEQRLGCDILAQLGAGKRPFATQSFPLVARVVETTKDLDTLDSGLSALGWLSDLRGVELLLLYDGHENHEIRLTIAQAFAALSEDPRSVDALIRLTTDSSDAVRDWATFGLASLTDDDSPKTRNALLDRLADPDATVRGEALVGLAIRQDERVIEPLRRALEETDREQGHDFAREALEELHDIERYPALVKWKTND